MTAPVAESGGEAALAAALLAPDRPAPQAVADPRRFAVYRNNVFVGLIDAIAATYPAVLALVGEEFFRAAAREFVMQHPPESPILIAHGGLFPEWIEAFPPAASVPYLGDVARLEWAWNRGYNAADADPMDAAKLTDLPPEQIVASCVTLHPSFATVASPYPVVSLWAQATRRVEPVELDLSKPENALIVRPHEVVDVRAISPVMMAFLQALAGGATIGEASEVPEADQDLISECLIGLFQLGLAVGLVARGSDSTTDNEDERSAE